MTRATAFIYNLSSNSSDGKKKDHRIMHSSRKIRAHNLTTAINHGGGNSSLSTLEVSWETGLVGLFLDF